MEQGANGRGNAQSDFFYHYLGNGNGVQDIRFATLAAHLAVGLHGNFKSASDLFFIARFDAGLQGTEQGAIFTQNELSLFFCI